MDAAEHLGERLKSAEDDAAAVSLAQALAKVARAVRQTVHLQARLREGPLQRRRAADGDAAAHAGARLGRVRQVLSEAIALSDPPVESPELWERLEAAMETERGAPERPVVESVMRIAAALDIIPLLDLEEVFEWRSFDIPSHVVRPP